MGRGAVVGMLFVTLVLAGAPSASAHHGPPYPSGPDHEHGEMVAYPMVFPVGGPNTFSDSFYAPRCCDPGEIHHATDVMAAKMVPVYAVTAGTVRYVNWSSNPQSIDPTRCCTLAIRHDDGWESWYIHLNNDTPGTDDGRGWGIATGILPGVRVAAGQLIGWVGDSGNAESTSPHLHFELIDPHGVRVNPYQALRTARDQGGLPRCEGRNATIFGDDDGDGVITGTDGDDVIAGTLGDDVVVALGGDDLVCGNDGRDTIDGGDGADTLLGGTGSDRIRGGRGSDRIVGDRGHDRLYGGKGGDDISDGPGDDRIAGGDGDDLLRSESGANTIDGGSGSDALTYAGRPAGIVVDLAGGAATDLVSGLERITGSPFADVLIGGPLDDALEGGDGADLITGGPGGDDLAGGSGDDTMSGGDGDDTLLGDLGDDRGDGGDGSDVCLVEVPTACEF